MHPLNAHPLVQEYLKMNRFGDTLGMHFQIMAPGQAAYFLNVTESHLATPTSAHGGVLSALLDAVMGVGALSVVCEEDKVVSTVEMKVSFLRPAHLGDQLTANSSIVKRGKKILFVEARIKNQFNDLVALSSGTFNSYSKIKAGY
ncbi:MAG: hypothetical protein RIT43_1205 [Bacteroidota bacterium]